MDDPLPVVMRWVIRAATGFNGPTPPRCPYHARGHGLHAPPPLPTTFTIVDSPHPMDVGSMSHACGLGLEGIVSKRIGSRYISGRTRAWLNRTTRISR